MPTSSRRAGPRGLAAAGLLLLAVGACCVEPHSIYLNSSDAYVCAQMREGGAELSALTGLLLGGEAPDGQVLALASLEVRGCWRDSAPDSRSDMCRLRLLVNGRPVLTGEREVCKDMFPVCSDASAVARFRAALTTDPWWYPASALNHVAVTFAYSMAYQSTRSDVCLGQASVALDLVQVALSPEPWPPGFAWHGDDTRACSQRRAAVTDSWLYVSGLVFPVYGSGAWARCATSFVVVVPSANRAPGVVALADPTDWHQGRLSEDGAGLVCEGMPALPNASEIEAAAAAAGAPGTAQQLVRAGAVRLLWRAHIGRSEASAVAVVGVAVAQLYEPPQSSEGEMAVVPYGAANLAVEERTVASSWNLTAWRDRLSVYPIAPVAFVFTPTTDTVAPCREGVIDDGQHLRCRFLIVHGQLGLDSRLCVSVDGGSRYFDSGTTVRVVRSGFVDSFAWYVALLLFLLPVSMLALACTPATRSIRRRRGSSVRQCHLLMWTRQTRPWSSSADPDATGCALIGVVATTALCVPCIVVAGGSQYPCIAAVLAAAWLTACLSLAAVCGFGLSLAGVVAAAASSVLFFCLIARTQFYPERPRDLSSGVLIAALCGLGLSLAPSCILFRGWSRCAVCSTCQRFFPTDVNLADWRNDSSECCKRQQAIGCLHAGSRLPDDVLLIVAAYAGTLTALDGGEASPLSRRSALASVPLLARGADEHSHASD